MNSCGSNAQWCNPHTQKHTEHLTKHQIQLMSKDFSSMENAPPEVKLAVFSTKLHMATNMCDYISLIIQVKQKLFGILKEN